MADVLILTSVKGPEEAGTDAWKRNVTAVVLPNKKVLSTNKYDEYLLNDEIKWIEKKFEKGGVWEGQPYDVTDLFGALTSRFTSPQNFCGIVSAELAREAMELSGGF